jgi:hypothetical protein
MMERFNEKRLTKDTDRNDLGICLEELTKARKTCHDIRFPGRDLTPWRPENEASFLAATFVYNDAGMVCGYNVTNARMKAKQNHSL